jgi:hypothetical protein
MSFIRTLLAHIGISERRKNQRMDAKGLTVSYLAGPEQKKLQIGNISPTGLYLVTEERWNPGTNLLLTLGEKSIFETSSRSQVKLWTRCVRVDENGVGLAFTHTHTNAVKWLEAMSKAPSMIAQSDPVQVFRLTRTLAFLFHISPASEADLLKLMTESLTRERAERAIETALLANDILESHRCESKKDLSPGLLLRLLEQVVQAEDDEMREYWARLLAACSLIDSQHDMSLVFVDLLSALTLFHLRVLTAAWSQANQADLKTGRDSSHGAYRTVAEAQAIAGIAVVEEIESIVNDLHEFGLLENTARAAVFDRLTEVNLTLSDLGLKFCERICGQPQPMEEESQNTAFLERYLSLESDYPSPANVRENLSHSLAIEAQTIRQSSNLALMG